MEWLEIYGTPDMQREAVSITMKKKNALFTGDTLFKGGCGRVDFPTEIVLFLLKSLSRIKNLELDADVYPGQ